MSNEEIEQREIKNQEEAKDQPQILNYIGEWEKIGVFSSKGRLWSHDELWEFTTKYKYLQKLANLSSESGHCILGNEVERHKLDKCLELGCDWGHAFPALEMGFEEVYGIEIVEWAAQAGVDKDRLIIHGNMNELPWDDNFFDAVLSNHVLEHADDIEVVLGEIHRVTKHGGYSVHTLPCRMDMWVEPESEIHKTLLNYRQWGKTFEENGFLIETFFWGWNHNQEEYTIIAKVLKGEQNLIERYKGGEQDEILCDKPL